MKRFWITVGVEPCEGGHRITLDGRPIRTQGGNPQAVPTRELAEAMADEWRGQGEQVDPKAFPLRDLADYAIDHVRGDREGTVAKLLGYAETDTLCYRAASLTVALAALEPGADPAALFDAANCEQDWQAELWGWDHEAERTRAAKLAAFEAAARFARLART